MKRVTLAAPQSAEPTGMPVPRLRQGGMLGSSLDGDRAALHMSVRRHSTRGRKKGRLVEPDN